MSFYPAKLNPENTFYLATAYIYQGKQVIVCNKSDFQRVYIKYLHNDNQINKLLLKVFGTHQLDTVIDCNEGMNVILMNFKTFHKMKHNFSINPEFKGEANIIRL